MSLPLSEKYRPATLEDIIGNEQVINALKRMTTQDELPHMLFYGPPGTGKTTAIRAIACEFYKIHYRSSVLELNASDERGIDTVRETIKNFANTSSFGNQVKLIILDEADSMSRDAQNAMRRVIEDYSKNARFCLIANYSSRIIGAIQSRCTKFRFSPVRGDVIRDRVINICENEGYVYEKEGINAIAEMCQGDIRKMVNDIEGTMGCYGELNAKSVYLLNGIVELCVFEDLFKKVLVCGFKELKYIFQQFKNEYSIDCEAFVSTFAELTVKSNLPNKMKILKMLSEIQYRLSFGCSEEIQINAIIGVFIKYR